MNGNGSQSRSRQGFTLLELIVVIGIIIILISILIPALSSSRMQAQIADTKSQLSNLSSACEQYQQIFQSYPGPVTEDDIASNKTTFTGNQNLLIGLGRRWATSNTVFGTVTPVKIVSAVHVNPSTTVDVYVDTTTQNSPMDWSRNGAAGVPYGSITFKDKDLYPATGTYSTLSTGQAFPVIVDHFRDGMPILYFRKIPGRTNVSFETSTVNPAFNVNTNAAFTSGSNVTATTGAVFPQDLDPAMGSAALKKRWSQMLGTVVGKDSSSNDVYSARGGYVIISAGPDHLYGTADDIIVSGGN